MPRHRLPAGDDEPMHRYDQREFLRLEAIRRNEEQARSLNVVTVEERERGRLPEHIDFACECGRQDCMERITATAPAWHAVHRDEPDRFMVVPGHEILDVERVVARHDGWLVV